MKKSLKIVLIMHLLLGIFTGHAQIEPSCETPGESIVWSSDIFEGFDARQCDNDVAIVASTRDIKIRNYIKVKGQRKLRFTPTGNHRIQILPDENEYNTPLNLGPKIGDRTTKTGSDAGSADDKSSVTLSLSPNPTSAELLITTNKEITHFYVVDFYGIPLLEGTTLINNTLSVADLAPGTYIFFIQTEAGNAAEHFIKN